MVPLNSPALRTPTNTLSYSLRCKLPPNLSPTSPPLPIPPTSLSLFRSSWWLRPQHTCLILWLPDVKCPRCTLARAPSIQLALPTPPSGKSACSQHLLPHPRAHPQTASDSHPRLRWRRSARRTCRERGGGGEQQESLAERRAQRSGHGHQAAAPGLRGPRAELGGRSSAGRFEVPGTREGSTAPSPF